MRKVDLSRNHFKKWVQFTKAATYASFVVAQEIVRHGKPFTNGKFCIYESIIKNPEHLFMDFKNKSEIVHKIEEMLLSAKMVKNRTIKLAENIT